MSTRLDALPHRHVLTLPTMPSAVRTARGDSRAGPDRTAREPASPHVDPALLILGELVTNSVRHAAVLSPQLTVIHAAGADTLAYAVHDRHPCQPLLYGAATDGGTGDLATVMELALGLGGSAVVRTDAVGRGESIWITLPL
ncbi:ATP-binding protein [Streptomyces bobili]